MTSLFRLDWSGIKHGTAKEGVEGCLSLGQATLTPSPSASARQSSTWLRCFLCYNNGASSPEDSRKAGIKTPQNGSWHHPPCTPDEAALGVSLPAPCTKHPTLRKPRPQGGAQKGQDRTPGEGCSLRRPAQLPVPASGPGPHLGGRGEGGGGEMHISRPRRTPKN